MKKLIKYEISNQAEYSLMFISSCISAGYVYLLNLSSDSCLPPIFAGFTGGFMAIAGYFVLIAIYERITKQYNSDGEWIADKEKKKQNKDNLW